MNPLDERLAPPLTPTERIALEFIKGRRSARARRLWRPSCSEGGREVKGALEIRKPGKRALANDTEARTRSRHAAEATIASLSGEQPNFV
jgi:hypothetical protein